jgi:hypothetical protein
VREVEHETIDKKLENLSRSTFIILFHCYESSQGAKANGSPLPINL